MRHGRTLIDENTPRLGLFQPTQAGRSRSQWLLFSMYFGENLDLLAHARNIPGLAVRVQADATPVPPRCVFFWRFTANRPGNKRRDLQYRKSLHKLLVGLFQNYLAASFLASGFASGLASAFGWAAGRGAGGAVRVSVLP